MSEFREVTDVIEVPSNAGIDGFLHTIRFYLRKPRVQSILIDSRGKVSVRRFVQEDDAERNVGIDFTELQPVAIVRNAHVEEVTVLGSANAAAVLGSLLDLVAVAHLKPLAFLTGVASAVWEWHRISTGVSLKSRETLYGLPLYTDRGLPDTALVLAAGFGRDAALVDTRNAFKIEIPTYKIPEATVEVLL
jgi:hypothetical protein